LKTFGFQNYQ